MSVVAAIVRTGAGYREGIVAGLHLLGRVRLQTGDRAGARSNWLRALDLAWSIGHMGWGRDVRTRVGALWDGIKRLVPLTSVNEVVASLLHP